MSREITIRIVVVPRVDGYLDVFRKAQRAVKDLRWAIRLGPITDEEKLALGWALDHVRRGHPELAAEDFTWLGKRMTAKS